MIRASFNIIAISINIIYLFYLSYTPTSLDLKIAKCNNTKVAETTQKQSLIFIGVMSFAKEYKRRSLLRALYSPFTLKNPDVKTCFILGLDPDRSVNELIREEANLYGDLFILDIPENMNQGKTYHFFSQVHGRSMQPFRFVMKADTDTYLHLDHIKQLFSQIPSDHTFWGARRFTHYMNGGCYALSWDLVEWISGHSIPKENQVGHEDWMVGEWFVRFPFIVKTFLEQPFGASENIDTGYLDYIFSHNMKAENDLFAAARHYMMNDTGPIPWVPDPTLRLNEPIPQDSFKLKVNKTHCLDSTYHYALTASSCHVESTTMYWTYSSGLIRNLYRDKCIGIHISEDYFNKVWLYDCYNEPSNQWDFRDELIYSRYHSSSVLAHRYRTDDPFFNTGLVLEDAEGLSAEIQTVKRN